MAAGMVFRGEFWTQNTLEHHKDDVESTLLEVLETCAPLESLFDSSSIEVSNTPAVERNQEIPIGMLMAYQKQISILSNMQNWKASAGPQARV